MPPVNNPSAQRMARWLLDGGHHVDSAQTVMDAAGQWQAAMAQGQGLIEVPMIDGSASLIFGPGVRAIVPRPKPNPIERERTLTPGGLTAD